MRTALREPSSARPRIPAVAGTGDRDLLALVRAGDDDAYAELYRRHAGSALRLARRLTSSPAASAFAFVSTTLV